MMRRLLLILLTIGATAATVYAIVDYLRYKQDREQRSVQLGQQAGLRVAKEIDARLSEIVTRAREYAAVVASIDDEDRLLESIREESLRFPVVLGVTVAFEPGVFRGKPRYAPFFNKARDEFQFVEDSYDYTSDELASTNWYTQIVASGRDGWSEPYFAEAAETMVVDYGIPILDRQDEIIGIVDYAITLSDFTRIIDAISVGEAGYGFTFDQTGTILSHPSPAYLMKNVFRLRDGKDEEILKTLREEPQGLVAYDSTYTYKHSWFFFRELESTGWKSVLVFSEDDLLGASDDGRRKIIHISIGIGILLIALLALAQGLDGFSRRELWSLATLVSLVIVGNIVLIWYLNLTSDFSHVLEDSERIVNQSVLNKYVEQYDDDLHRLVNDHYRKVPTGVFIETYELTSFEASLIGKLWMKYPKDLYPVTPPGFYFPGVSARETRALLSEKISEVERDDHVLVIWRFRATLEQDFSYSQFPFDQNDVRLDIQYPDLSQNILLVPDLASYDILDPSVRPGVNPDVSVPSAETISSYFTMGTRELTTRFGNSGPALRNPVLSFNMIAKRIYLNPIIANIVPVLIVALIMFIVLYISSNEENGRAGLSTMNVIQSSAGFLFILLLAHVNERNRIETPEIAYIELFYFSMYLYITLQTIALAAMFSGVDWKLFRYRDNLALKVLYWPVLLSIWYGFTLMRFY